MAISSFINENRKLICEQYAEGIQGATSKNDMAELLDVNVCEWICMMQPRHNSSKWIDDNFKRFVNGKLKQCDGYTCEVWNGNEVNEVGIRATVTALVGCGNVKVTVPPMAFAKVCCSGCNLAIEMGKDARLLVLATDDVEIEIGKGERKQIERKELKTL